MIEIVYSTGDLGEAFALDLLASRPDYSCYWTDFLR